MASSISWSLVKLVSGLGMNTFDYSSKWRVIADTPFNDEQQNSPREVARIYLCVLMRTSVNLRHYPNTNICPTMWKVKCLSHGRQIHYAVKGSTSIAPFLILCERWAVA